MNLTRGKVCISVKLVPRYGEAASCARSTWQSRNTYIMGLGTEGEKRKWAKSQGPLQATVSKDLQLVLTPEGASYCRTVELNKPVLKIWAFRDVQDSNDATVIPGQTPGQDQLQWGSLASRFKGMLPIIPPAMLEWCSTRSCSGHSGPGSRVRVERRKNHAPNLKADPGDPFPPGTLDLLSLYNLDKIFKIYPFHDHWSLVDPLSLLRTLWQEAESQKLLFPRSHQRNPTQLLSAIRGTRFNNIK